MSVESRIHTEALVFGGNVLTTSDVAVAAGLANFGDASKVTKLEKEFCQSTLDVVRAMTESAIDQMKVITFYKLLKPVVIFSLNISFKKLCFSCSLKKMIAFSSGAKCDNTLQWVIKKFNLTLIFSDVPSASLTFDLDAEFKVAAKNRFI